MSMELEQSTSIESPILLEEPAPTSVQPAPRRPPLDRRDSVWGRVRFFESFTSLAVVHDDDETTTTMMMMMMTRLRSMWMTSERHQEPPRLRCPLERTASMAYTSRSQRVSRAATACFAAPEVGMGGSWCFRRRARHEKHDLAAGAGSVARPRSWSAQLSAAPALPLARVDPASDPTARSTRISMPLGYVCYATHTHITHNMDTTFGFTFFTLYRMILAYCF